LHALKKKISPDGKLNVFAFINEVTFLGIRLKNKFDDFFEKRSEEFLESINKNMKK